MLQGLTQQNQIHPLNVFTYYNKQRFTQFGSMDCSNWYGVADAETKKGQALYPAMGRQHITYFGLDVLIFTTEPSQIFKTINYWYAIVGTSVIQVDKFYNQRVIGSIPLGAQTWFDFLPVGDLVYGLLTAETVMYVITENMMTNTVTYQAVTDPRAPTQPLFVGTFGNSFVVSQANTPYYYVSQYNAGGIPLDVTMLFSEGNPPTAIVNRASGIIRQIGVLHNQMYIFSDFTTDVWANIPSTTILSGAEAFFPFKLNTSYNWDYGIYDPFSLSIDFGRMCFLGKNQSGLVAFMTSNGQQPETMSTQAINVLLQNSTESADAGLSPFLTGPTNGFLYQYENTIFYRVSAGPYLNYGELDVVDSSDALEFNFGTMKWGRVTELNGERCRIDKHIYFNNQHLVTVQGDPAIYQMAGNIYHNELSNPSGTPNTPSAFLKYPMRYLLVTEQIYQPDYAEFITDYIEIDFVFGDKTFYESNAPFDNTTFIITEDAAPDGSPIYCIAEDQINAEDVFLITEDGNTPGFDDNHYNLLFKPFIGLYYSDDGGVTYSFANSLQFSNLGQYRWRMRWYELGTSRNRTYKLVAVSSAPIVILGGVQSTRRASGGAN